MNLNLSDLEKLSDLRQKGILTEEEFQTKKKQILGDTPAKPQLPQENLSTNKTPKKESDGCLKIIIFLFIGSFVIIFISLIFVFTNTKKEAKPVDNELLISDKPKTDQQKIDSAKISNENFESLSPKDQIASLEKELENKKLTKIQKEEINIEIKNIKELEFAKKNISAWDRSNPKLVRAVKKAMNDPESFEHVETTFDYKKNKVVATMIYRGKNAFGGLVLGTVNGTFDYDGNLLEIQDSN
ncbi:SHOCT domain-containing protein [Frigoriflavimonas asaccharolytica]|uniref:Cytoskeletal protein RodZ n=1 Tax=Frigoriflavimonas asaccharolytica TaxID=2735899 RepID=A0A8J8GD11_9FLAO|nr:SHOCT domain-containing protein [Frigoriflavimonas asaccharolytica]NRS93989.1 cytoskeletal protein RodZ [Frigoriflavimonas asaccharolytica]